MKNKKVVEFVQAPSTTKRFRHDYPISDEMKETLVCSIYTSFLKYVFKNNYPYYHDLIQDFINGHPVKPGKRDMLEYNLFFWRVLYDSKNGSSISWVEDYIAENLPLIGNKHIIKSWLREWDKAIPSFYFVGQKYSDRAAVVVNTLTQETLDVILFDPESIPFTNGEIIMGTLIPIGDELYFPILDFYHFEMEARRDIAQYIHYAHEKKNSSIYEAFIHILSAALQLEHHASKEKDASHDNSCQVNSNCN